MNRYVCCCVPIHVNPLEIQVSNFKLTVLCVPWEFSSGTGTVGKPWSSSFVFCTRFRSLSTFWLLFSSICVDFTLEKHQNLDLETYQILDPGSTILGISGHPDPEYRVSQKCEIDSPSNFLHTREYVCCGRCPIFSSIRA